MRTDEIEGRVGHYLLERLRSAGRAVRVNLDEPEMTCRIEITPRLFWFTREKVPASVGCLPTLPAAWCACSPEDSIPRWLLTK